MKTSKLCLVAGALAATAIMVPGCHGSTQQVPVTRANFGYPGMKMDASYYAAMAKIRASQASHPNSGVKIMPQTPPANNQAANKPQQPQPIH